MIDAFPYVGKENRFTENSLPTYYVKSLSETVLETNRNVTCDNWFTSISLAEDMLKDFGLTLVGTMRKNKGDIPPMF